MLGENASVLVRINVILFLPSKRSRDPTHIRGEQPIRTVQSNRSIKNVNPSTFVWLHKHVATIDNTNIFIILRLKFQKIKLRK